MSLTKKLLNNPGLVALTVEAEQKEIAVVKRRIKFAFFQPMLDGTKVPFWHVNWVSPTEFGTTLSMQGLKDWKIL